MPKMFFLQLNAVNKHRIPNSEAYACNIQMFSADQSIMPNPKLVRIIYVNHLYLFYSLLYSCLVVCPLMQTGSALKLEIY